MDLQLAADSSMGSGAFIAYGLGSFVLTVLTIAGMWMTFSKAGRHGWAAIIPFYNIYVECKVAGKPGWWLVLYFIPIVNIVISIIVAVNVAKNFGKGGAFGFFLLWLLPFIGFPILGFGSATYQGVRPAEQQPVAAY